MRLKNIGQTLGHWPYGAVTSSICNSHEDRSLLAGNEPCPFEAGKPNAYAG